MQQEPFLFNTTIFKNVEFGLIGTKWEHASKKRKRALIKRACEEAFADEFISRLPEVSVYITLVTTRVMKTERYRATKHKLEIQALN